MKQPHLSILKMDFQKSLYRLLSDNEIFQKIYNQPENIITNLKNFQINDNNIIFFIGNLPDNSQKTTHNINFRVFELLSNYEILHNPNNKNKKYKNDEYYVIIEDKIYYCYSVFFNLYTQKDLNYIEQEKQKQKSQYMMIIKENQKTIIIKYNTQLQIWDVVTNWKIKQQIKNISKPKVQIQKIKKNPQFIIVTILIILLLIILLIIFINIY